MLNPVGIVMGKWNIGKGKSHYKIFTSEIDSLDSELDLKLACRVKTLGDEVVIDKS